MRARLGRKENNNEPSRTIKLATHLSCLGDEVVDDGDAGGQITAASRCFGSSDGAFFARETGEKKIPWYRAISQRPRSSVDGPGVYDVDDVGGSFLPYCNACDAPKYARVGGWFPPPPSTLSQSPLAEDAQCTPAKASGAPTHCSFSFFALARRDLILYSGETRSQPIFLGPYSSMSPTL